MVSTPPQLGQPLRSHSKRFVLLTNRETRKIFAEMFVGILIEYAWRDTGNTDFRREPLCELNVVFDLPRRNAAPINHDGERDRGLLRQA